MGPEQLVFMIPIVAIAGSFVTAIVKALISSKERRFEMQLQMRQTGNVGLEAKIAALSDEIARLRDTSTSYDLTIDSQLQRIERRLDYVEERQIRQAGTSDLPEQNVQRSGGVR